MTPLEQSFLRDIKDKQDDDSPRLIYADWLDEQGRGERAEFIRYDVLHPHAGFAWLTGKEDVFPYMGIPPGEPQPVGVPDAEVRRTWMWGEAEHLGCVIHDLGRDMTYRIDRGFINQVQCPIRSWYGLKCHCINSGRVVPDCQYCDGKGTTEPFGPDLVRVHPTVQKVILTDVKPILSPSKYWVLFDLRNRSAIDPYLQHHVPTEIFDSMVKQAGSIGTTRFKEYKTLEEAEEALFTGCALWAWRKVNENEP